MHTTVVTTITTTIDLHTFEAEHDVHLEGEPGVPEDIILGAATGAIRSVAMELGFDTVEREEEQ